MGQKRESGGLLAKSNQAKTETHNQKKLEKKYVRHHHKTTRKQRRGGKAPRFLILACPNFLTGNATIRSSQDFEYYRESTGGMARFAVSCRLLWGGKYIRLEKHLE